MVLLTNGCNIVEHDTFFVVLTVLVLRIWFMGAQA